MPELPEVETVRRGLAQRILGERMLQVEFARADLRRPMPVAAITALRGRRCTACDRRSKYLLIRFDGVGDPVVIVHLGMSGRVFVEDVHGRSLPPWRLHEHWRMRLGDRLVRYVDPRRFGALDLVDATGLSSHPLLATLGPEPLGEEFDAEYLFAKTRGRKVAIKPLLMDAHVVVGVGNIYASESCFRAGVRPSRAAGRLTRADCAKLVDAVRHVLERSIRAGGTTLRDYVGVAEDSGWFQRELAVYGRAGEPCRVCGAKIRHAVMGQRATYWCPRCQR